MTAERYTGLQIDEHIDEILDAGTSDDATALLAPLMDSDPQRLAWGMGRALARLKTRDVDLNIQAQMVVHEIEHARAGLAPNINFLEDQLEAMTLERRESGAGNFLDIPGVGRWSTRKVGAGWDINDPAAVIESLDADERAQFVEDLPKLKAAEFRAHLDQTGEVPDGVERRPERISVSYKLSDRAAP